MMRALVSRAALVAVPALLFLGGAVCGRCARPQGPSGGPMRGSSCTGTAPSMWVSTPTWNSVGGSVLVDGGLDPQGDVCVLARLENTAFLAGGSTLLISGYAGARGDARLHERLRLWEPWAGPAPRVFTDLSSCVTTVRTPESLCAAVDIDSEEGALAYCRLWTSPATVRCLQDARWVEVAPLSAIGADYLFGRRDHIGDLHRWATACGDWRNFGVLTQAEWDEAGLTPARSEQSGGNYVVTRWQAPGDWPPPDDAVVSLVRQTVTQDGAISREVIETRQLPGGLKVTILPEM